MYGKIKDHLAKELKEIEEAGLFKSPQGKKSSIFVRTTI